MKRKIIFSTLMLLGLCAQVSLIQAQEKTIDIPALDEIPQVTLKHKRGIDQCHEEGDESLKEASASLPPKAKIKKGVTFREDVKTHDGLSEVSLAYEDLIIQLFNSKIQTPEQMIQVVAKHYPQIVSDSAEKVRIFSLILDKYDDLLKRLEVDRTLTVTNVKKVMDVDEETGEKMIVGIYEEAPKKTSVLAQGGGQNLSFTDEKGTYRSYLERLRSTLDEIRRP